MIDQRARYFYTGNMGASFVTPWFDVTSGFAFFVQTDVATFASAPVGVITCEATVDYTAVYDDNYTNKLPSASTARGTQVQGLMTLTGDAWSTAYNGLAAKMTIGNCTSSTMQFPYVRIRWTRTSGGASDILRVSVMVRG